MVTLFLVTNKMVGNQHQSQKIILLWDTAGIPDNIYHYELIVYLPGVLFLVLVVIEEIVLGVPFDSSGKNIQLMVNYKTMKWYFYSLILF